MLEALFQPCKIETIEIKNRIVMPPMITFLANEDGAVTQRIVDYYTERARGGVGMIIVEAAYVKEENRAVCRLGIENPRLHVGLSELAESIQERGARAFLQLHDRGSVLRIDTGKGIIKGKGPDDLSLQEVHALIEAFSEAALSAQKAGFDGVEINGANVYLINQFLSPLTNHRQDAYGRTFEGRMKFPVDIFLQARKKVGKDYPIIFRMVGDQHADGGLTLDDARVIAQRMEDVGASALHVIANGPTAIYLHCPPMAVPRGCHVHLAAEIRKAVRIPVITVGRINDPVLADQILREGKADLIAMGRPLIADPYLPLKAQEGRLEEIRKCLACNYCRNRSIQKRRIRCAVNAEAARERDLRISPSFQPKRVMVVGGGVCGMEAARVLALRGHRVALYEKEEKLGGQVNLAMIPPHKEELRNILDYLVGQIKQLKVEVRTASEVTGKTIEEENPEVIILAVGASPCLPDIPGLGHKLVFMPREALQETRPMGEKILVAGGGMVGCEVAEFLATQGKQVTIAEKLPEIASGMEAHTKTLLLERLSKLGVKFITDGEIVSFQGSQATLQKNGEAMTVQADSVVVALGSKADNSLKEFLLDTGRPLYSFYSVGDCGEGWDIAAAIQGGHRVAMDI